MDGLSISATPDPLTLPKIWDLKTSNINYADRNRELVFYGFYDTSITKVISVWMQ